MNVWLDQPRRTLQSRLQRLAVRIENEADTACAEHGDDLTVNAAVKSCRNTSAGKENAILTVPSAFVSKRGKLFF